MCGLATAAPSCQVCTQSLTGAGVDTRQLASARMAAAAALWLAVRPGLPFRVLADVLADIAAEAGAQPFSHTDLTGPIREPWSWLDLDALRPLVTDAVKAAAARRRKADEQRAAVMSERTRLTSAGWV
jgi:hypothetical protein